MNVYAPPERDTGLAFHLDTNRINAYERLEAVNQLEQWDRDQVILLELSEAAHAEALADRNPVRHRKAHSHLVSLNEITNREEVQVISSIESILFPDGAKSVNEQNDVLVVFNARKYGALLITADGASRRQPGGMLGNRKRLAKIGVQIMTDEEAVQLVRDRITMRDRDARKWAEVTGNALPGWVGRD